MPVPVPQNARFAGAGNCSWLGANPQDCCAGGHACPETVWQIDSNHDNRRAEDTIGTGAKYVMTTDVPSSGKVTTDNSDPDGKCSPGDWMFSTETMPAGSFMSWYLMDPVDAPVSTTQYITIVNLTPYRFVKTSQHSYQFDVFDFDDIPSGKARQNTMRYTTAVGANPKDDNGEVYYHLEGTDMTFEVRATTHIPDDYPQRTVVDLSGMGLGQREYKDPDQEVPVTLVITGSEDYGYISSVRFGPTNNWMHQIYDTIKDRQLRHVVMPGSHDAGMTTISGAWSGLGDSANTQTQGLNIYNQLRVGARWFDMRLVSVKGGDFYAAHVNDEISDTPVGATGEKLDDIINDINKFTAESPGEIIIWWVRYMVDMNYNIPAGTGRYWTADKANEFYTILERINNRCPDLDNNPKFDRLTAQAFMDRNGGAGCVLIMTDGRLEDGVPADRPSSGIYHGPDFMDHDDYWADKEDTKSNSEAQIAHMKGNARDAGNNDDLLITQWQCTPNLLASALYGLDRIAILPTNPALYWAAVNAMTPDIWPSVILQDYVGYILVGEGAFPEDLGPEIRVLVVGLNLYMVSQNCAVSPGKNPLLQKAGPAVAAAVDTLDSWRFGGIVYANGTMDEDPPPGFHLGRAKVLKAGTVFGNGTVLGVDVLNPEFEAPA